MYYIYLLVKIKKSTVYKRYAQVLVQEILKYI